MQSQFTIANSNSAFTPVQSSSIGAMKAPRVMIRPTPIQAQSCFVQLPIPQKWNFFNQNRLCTSFETENGAEAVSHAANAAMTSARRQNPVYAQGYALWTGSETVSNVPGFKLNREQNELDSDSETTSKRSVTPKSKMPAKRQYKAITRKPRKSNKGKSLKVKVVSSHPLKDRSLF